MTFSLTGTWFKLIKIVIYWPPSLNLIGGASGVCHFLAISGLALAWGGAGWGGGAEALSLVAGAG